MTEVIEKPRCKTAICKRELTFLEKQGCWRCLICNPIPKKKPVEEESREKYIDVPLTPEEEGRIRAIVKDEIANWHVPKDVDDDLLPMTASEVADEVTASKARRERIKVNQHEKAMADAPEVEQDKHPNWRAEAKELGIPLAKETGGARFKKDVIADIEERLGVGNG